jgi:tRNA modification GTPase
MEKDTGRPETIFALATPAGVSAVAVARISGPRAGEALRLLTGRELPPARRAVRRALVDPANGSAFDDALVLWFPAPGSFTGEDLCEIQLHGSRATTRALVAALAAMSELRLARPGEFVRRAFDRGKLDLAQVEGLADLVAAETAQQARQAMRQLAGGLGAACEAWRSALMTARAHVEAEIDFPDEDVPDGAARRAGPILMRVEDEIRRALGDAGRAERLRDGFAVALAGPPNAGKSSIVNYLAGREAAIVSTVAGTTRDVLEVDLDLGGWPVTVADTAGLRDLDLNSDSGQRAIEQEGIRRARERAARADLTLIVVPADEGARALAEPLIAALLRPNAVVVWNKLDLAPAFVAPPWQGESVSVSARMGTGLETLTRVIETRARAALGGGDEPGIITRARHREILSDTCAAVARARATGSAEVMAEELRLACTALGRITGRAGVEDMLDLLFSTFCIGK